MPRIWLVAGLMLACAVPAVSRAEDAEGAKEIPYFSRMPGFAISETTLKEFDTYQFYDGKKIVSIEGRYHQNHYERPEEAGPTVSLLQIRRNFASAIRAAGGTILFDGQVEAFDDTRSGADIVWGRFERAGKDVWVEAWPYGDNNYYLTVVERQAMRQDVTATDLLKALESQGHVALYVNFDTGRSTLRPDAAPTIEQVATLLQQSASLRLVVEGHTDNVGAAATNKTLSQARAKAVVDALVAKGIEPARLSAAGWGQEKPIADNGSEAGRAKNRRVELVKK